MNLFRIQTGILSITVFLSAFLLFMVQPLFAKMILPVLGGSAAVWTTAMLFFQSMLLWGYLYAHFVARYLTIQLQTAFHFLLIVSAVMFLPFEFQQTSVVPDQPIFWVLFVAISTIGWPFFVLSATAPLLQRWFSLTNHPKRENPYFLYAASNLGSMLALLGYPFLIERFVGLHQQQALWHTSYNILAALFLISGIVIVKNRETTLLVEQQSSPASSITWTSRTLWVLLAFIPSSLMLGLTSYVTTDIAAVSLFWIVPLVLYLLSFIIVFSSIPQPPFKFYVSAFCITVIALVISFTFADHNKAILIVLNTLLFFQLCCFFHAKLVVYKPPAARLTEFYIWLAVGGMAGGIFNAIIAPLVFNQAFEYLLVLFFSLSIIVVLGTRKNISDASFIRVCASRFLILLLILVTIDFVMSEQVSAQLLGKVYLASLFGVAAAFLLFLRGTLYRRDFIISTAAIGLFCVALPFLKHEVLLNERSFYGSMRVKEEQRGDILLRLFLHGTTTHGVQIFNPKERQKEPIYYYHQAGAFGDIARGYIRNQEKSLKIGIIGLGSGALSCTAKGNDDVVFFEIDQKVATIAKDNRYFTFLELCPAEVIVGDGRLKLQEQVDASFDLLYLDAFSSDSVPAHLLTQEAIDLYLPKLKFEGALVIHISNRYLDLKRVVANYRLPAGYHVYYAPAQNKDLPFYAPQSLALIVHQDNLSENIRNSTHWYKLERDPNFRDWTDDFTNIVNVMISPFGK